jgi:hypothetical protein
MPGLQLLAKKITGRPSAAAGTGVGLPRVCRLRLDLRLIAVVDVVRWWMTWIAG